jgi:hypothetical protein
MVITTLKSPGFDKSTITDVTFIGGGTCTWTQDATGLKINLPAAQANNLGYAVKISFSGTIPKVN